MYDIYVCLCVTYSKILQICLYLHIEHVKYKMLLMITIMKKFEFLLYSFEFVFFIWGINTPPPHTHTAPTTAALHLR